MQDNNIPCPNDTTNNDCNLYMAITTMILACHPLTLQFKHVKGHQDEKANWPLTIEEILNIELWSTRQTVHQGQPYKKHNTQ